ncbi:SDR family oxidoreductase [Cupriavidus cauae]|uniref:SDR family oxidoreductase n=2 Tax=Cupriavidus TaxID=106589 RepID=A0A5M8BDA5_9BURK|nr:SDR family oxidoreductase [Cupriavidus sp. DB3]KAA0179533.1 SDR family oxidoreductase [Cupriavidus gilardii]KAA6130934.1 SDR family oxidoreductase [Cupriavidus cauae]MCA7086125.1 SDR family oxidoreductase [Cupriavidus sp. DB3]UZN48081.1 SDR family oxidoreductase [Cupriavidus cauae]
MTAPAAARSTAEVHMGLSINLEGKVAMVTGASSGLGMRFAQVLSAAGAKVVLASRRAERLKELRAAIEADGGSAHVVRLDVTDPDSIRAAVAHAETEAGAIDIVVNNSGVSTTQRLTDVTAEDFDFVFDTNTRGAFFVAQEVAKRMIARSKGAERNGTPLPQSRIINIASVAGLKVLSQIGVYCMSKAAVVHMTKAMALEWARYGINVNAICPGYIDTDINHHHWDTDAGQKLIQLLPRKRLGKPEDLDGLLLLLASDQSQFINGAVITADDGMV